MLPKIQLLEGLSRLLTHFGAVGVTVPVYPGCVGVVGWAGWVGWVGINFPALSTEFTGQRYLNSDYRMLVSFFNKSRVFLSSVTCGEAARELI